MKSLIKNLKNILVVLAFVGLNASASAQVVDNGTCGDNLIWQLTGRGKNLTLTISGTGAMYDYAFGNPPPWFPESKNIKTLVLPSRMTTIGNIAFYECSGLTSVTIPTFVMSIGEYAFCNCSGLIAINVNANNQNFSSDNGVLFTKNKTVLIQYPPKKKTGSYTIPNGVRSIGEGAFGYCDALTSVTIPNSVTYIGESAFKYCSGLISVTIPNNVTFIGKWAFEYCSGLTSVTIPNSVTYIGGGAFRDCSGLTSVTIPNSVETIENWVFLNCTGLTSVTIPNSVTSIGHYAFSGCSGLTSVVNNRATPQDIINKNVFNRDTYENATLYVPSTFVSAYRTAKGWQEFKNIQAYR